jgi:hypothetical protein
MQTKSFAIIAAASLAISLGWTAIGNSQDLHRQAKQDLERQGNVNEVCRQSVLKLADLNLEANKTGAFSTFSVLGKKAWNEKSLPEKRLFVRAMETMVASMIEGLEIMTLRRVNSCPQHDLEQPWAKLTEEWISEEKDRLSWSRFHLALEQVEKRLGN